MRIPRRLIFGDVGDVDLYMLPGVDARSVSCRHLKLQQVESTVHLTMSSAVEAIPQPKQQRTTATTTMSTKDDKGYFCLPRGL